MELFVIAYHDMTPSNRAPSLTEHSIIMGGTKHPTVIEQDLTRCFTRSGLKFLSEASYLISIGFHFVIVCPFAASAFVLYSAEADYISHIAFDCSVGRSCFCSNNFDWRSCCGSDFLRLLNGCWRYCCACYL